MTKSEILEALARLTLLERQEISRQLAEWEEEYADLAAASRAQELSSGAVQSKPPVEVFRNARAALG